MQSIAGIAEGAGSGAQLGMTIGGPVGGLVGGRFILGQWAAAGGIIYRPFADSIAAGDGRFLWPAANPCRPWRTHIGLSGTDCSRIYKDR